MPDSVAALRRKPYAAFLAAGIASGLLYSSIALFFVFLVPVQIAFGRYGRREGLAAAGLSGAVIAAALVARLVAAGAIGSGGALALAAGMLPPLVLLGALALANAPIWRGPAATYKIAFVTAACAVLSLPLVLSLERDASIAAYLTERVASLLKPLRTAAGQGYEASALAAALDPTELVAASLETLRNSYAAILLTLIGGGWMLGNRLSGPGSRGREETGPVDELRLPYALLWAFLASWTLVLASALLKAPRVAGAIAWNCALALSLAYAVQGLGIAAFLLKKWKTPRSLRIVLAATAILALATPTAGFAVAVALPLLGVTEIWIPYRTPKGVGA